MPEDTAARPDRSLLVMKLGGALEKIPGALDAVAAELPALGRRWNLVVVPGGGRFADAVRGCDRELGLSDDAAHWMAILGMDQYAHLLADRIPGAVLVEEPGEIPDVHARERIAVLAPYAWMRRADVLPHTWDATSDSVAAFVAGALDAARLVLVKPVEGEATDLVDRWFPLVLPVGLPWTVAGWQRVGELGPELEGSGG